MEESITSAAPNRPKHQPSPHTAPDATLERNSLTIPSPLPGRRDWQVAQPVSPDGRLRDLEEMEAMGMSAFDGSALQLGIEEMMQDALKQSEWRVEGWGLGLGVREQGLG